MAPGFRLADEESTAHDGGSVQVTNTSSHAQHGAALTITFDFSSAPQLLCPISAHFRSVFTAFLASMYLYSDSK